MSLLSANIQHPNVVCPRTRRAGYQHLDGVVGVGRVC